MSDVPMKPSEKKTIIYTPPAFIPNTLWRSVRVTQIRDTRSKWDRPDHPVRYTLKRAWPIILLNMVIGALIGALAGMI